MVHFLFVLLTGLALIISFDSSAQTFEGADVDYFKTKSNRQEKNLNNIKNMEEALKNYKPQIKSDAQIKREKTRMPDNWKEMTQAEQAKYVDSVFEDRFVLMTGNIRYTQTGSGSKICSLRLLLMNNSSRKIKKIFVKYHWGETSTFASFEDVEPVKMVVSDIALYGSVCPKVMDGADYEVTTCQVEGLTEDQCKLRLFPIK